MQGTLNIHTRQLTAEAIRAIRERFGDVQLQIKAQDDNEGIDLLSEEKCWELIALLDWSEIEEDVDLVVSPLITALQEHSVAHIYQFADWLSYALWRLDTSAHAKIFMEEEQELSVDDFLYARCAVVANGQEYFEHILQHPNEMPEEVTFEPLLYVPQNAFKEKTGEEMIHIPLFNYETYSNQDE